MFHYQADKIVCEMKFWFERLHMLVLKAQDDTEKYESFLLFRNSQVAQHDAMLKA